MARSLGLGFLQQVGEPEKGPSLLIWDCLSCPVHCRVKGSVFVTPLTLNPCPLHAQPWQSRLSLPTVLGNLGVPAW